MLCPHVVIATNRSRRKWLDGFNDVAVLDHQRQWPRTRVLLCVVGSGAVSLNSSQRILHTQCTHHRVLVVWRHRFVTVSLHCLDAICASHIASLQLLGDPNPCSPCYQHTSRLASGSNVVVAKCWDRRLISRRCWPSPSDWGDAVFQSQRSRRSWNVEYLYSCNQVVGFGDDERQNIASVSAVSPRDAFEMRFNNIHRSAPIL